MNSSIASGIDSCVSPSSLLRLSVKLPEGTVLSDDEAVEAIRLFSTLRRSEGLPSGHFNAEHMCEIHAHLFDILGDAAGTYRKSVAGDFHTTPKDIEGSMNVWASDLADDALMGQDALSESYLHNRIAHFAVRLLQIRPFEVGNGVLARCFMEEMIKAHGMLIDWSKTSGKAWSLAVGAAIRDGSFDQLADILTTVSLNLGDDEGMSKADTLARMAERAPTLYKLLKREMENTGHLNASFPQDFETSAPPDNSPGARNSMGP